MICSVCGKDLFDNDGVCRVRCCGFRKTIDSLKT